MQNYLRPSIFRVSDSVYGELDGNLGVKYKPDSAVSYAYVDTSGKVHDCIKNLSVTNSSGFRGLDTTDDYINAPFRIVVSGDSFSHWNNEGKTIVDFMKLELQRSNIQASAINVAGGGFGIQQMLVSAASAVSEFGKRTPNLIVIQFIRDDITRAWWYSQSVKDDSGYTRARIARTTECLSVGSRCGADQYIVNPRATNDWCQSQLLRPDHNEVSESISRQYSDIVGLNFTNTRRLLTEFTGLAFDRGAILPRITTIHDIKDDRFEKALATLRRTGAKILFIYLPIESEIRAKRVSLSVLESEAISYYQTAINAPAIMPSDYSSFDHVKNFAVSKFDRHPSLELQRAYGNYVSKIVLKQLH